MLMALLAGLLKDVVAAHSSASVYDVAAASAEHRAYTTTDFHFDIAYLNTDQHPMDNLEETTY